MFVAEYMKDKNATQAAIRSGYSKKTAYSIGSENLKKPEIAEAIEYKLKEVEEKSLVTSDYVIQGFRDVAERCMQREPVMRFDYEEKQLVQEQEEVTDKDGKTHTEGVWKFDSHGANKALESLGRYLNLFKDKDQATEIVVNITDYSKKKDKI